MKKKKINKTRLKIFIALTLMFTLITTIFIGTKTFAYESDKISYTITQLSGDDFTTYETINNNNNYIDVNYSNGLYMKNDNTFTYKKYYLCINYILLNNNNEPYTYHSPDRATITPYGYMSNTYRQAQGVYYNNYEYNYNGTYYTQIIPITFTTNWNNTITKFRFQGFNSHIRIYNIDIVSSEDLGLSQYYETYYSQIEEQYEQLQDNFENLQDDYSQLENDYNFLEDDYNELETNYNTLQENASALNGIATNGLWDLIKNTDENPYSGMDYWNGTDLIPTTAYGTRDQLLTMGVIDGLYFNPLVDLPNNYNIRDIHCRIYFTENRYNIINVNNCDIQISTNLEIGSYATPTNATNFNVIVRPQNNGIIDERFGTTFTLGISNSQLEEWNYRINYDNLYSSYAQYLDYYNCLYAIDFTFKYDSNVTNPVFLLQSMNSQYNVGYAQGWLGGTTQANTNSTNTINQLTANYDEQISELNSDISDLNTQIRGLEIANLRLQQQLQTNDSYNLNTLIWTIGSVPFESFKQIWNINFLGVNIANFVLGFISTFIGLYIVKKFFL